MSEERVQRPDIPCYSLSKSARRKNIYTYLDKHIRNAADVGSLVSQNSARVFYSIK